MRGIKKISILLLLFLFFTGCSVKQIDNNKIKLYDYNDLKEYLPNNQSSWQYEGTGNYYHVMSIEDIITLEKGIVYKITGEVHSLSSDDKFNDYEFSLRYILDNEGLRQEKNENNMLDSKFDSLYLIKFPIKQGNTWSEIVFDKEGKKRKINATIVSINNIENNKKINVLYEERGSNYYEKRTIESGKGITDFIKNIEYDNTQYQVGYKLYDFEKGNKNKEDYLKENIKEFLIDYNLAWEEYYNSKDEVIFEYILSKSQLEKNIKSFSNKSDIKIDFMSLEIDSIDKINDNYHVKVKENYLKKLNDDFVRESNFIEYLLVEVDGKYFIKSQKKLKK